MTQVLRRQMTLLIATHVVDDFYQGAVPAILPFLVTERHYGYAAATGVTLAATFLSSLVQPLFGVLTDRRRMRLLIGAGMTIAGVGIGLCGLLDSYVFTWAAVALSGIGVAAYHPEASRTARMIAGSSAKGMSYFAVGGNAGIAVAPLVVAPILSITGLAGTPLLAVPALLMAGVLCFTGLAAVGPSAPRTPVTAGERDDWRAFGWLTGAVVARSILYFGVSSFLALYLIHRFGVSKTVGSAALTTLTGTGVLGTIAGGRLADRIGRVATVRLGHLLVLPGLLLLVLAPSAPLVFAAAVVLGFGLWLPFAVSVTLGQEYLPNRVGTASGVTLGLAVSVGGMVAPLLGVLADARGLRTALAVLLVLPVAALAILTRLRDAAPVPQRVLSLD
jgi:MFS transporter, FSR family, fosmidomycin resistance protein